MPKAWSDTYRRYYDRVEQTEIEHGRSEKKAQQIAARTLNRQRHDEPQGKTRIKKRPPARKGAG